MRLAFEDEGRAPARSVTVELEFPDEFEALDELPERPAQPRRPIYEPPGLQMMGMKDYSLIPVPDHSLARVTAPGNVSAPRYRSGSLIAEIHIEKLLHGVPAETDDPPLLRCTADGDFSIPWTMHAENLPEPVTGSLRLKVVTETISGPPIASLEELLESDERRSDETSDDT